MFPSNHSPQLQRYALHNIQSNKAHLECICSMSQHGQPCKLPGLIFALTFHQSPFLKFLECGECDEMMRSCSASWLLFWPFILFNKVLILYQLLSNKFSCPNTINFRHSTKINTSILDIDNHNRK